MSATTIPTHVMSADQAGFTVVELLVAMALFAVLGTLVFGSLHFGLRAWEIGSARAEQNDQIGTTQNLLRRILSNVYPLFMQSDPTHPAVEFDGSRDVVSFLADAPVAAGAGGRFRFKLAVARNEGRSDLVLTSSPELAEETASVRTGLLLADVARVELAYLGAADLNGPDRWQDSWRRRPELPRLVRVRVMFRDGDSRSWPDLVVGPRISVDVGCIYDPLTRRCRGR